MARGARRGPPTPLRRAALQEPQQVAPVVVQRRRATHQLLCGGSTRSFQGDKRAAPPPHRRSRAACASRCCACSRRDVTASAETASSACAMPIDADRYQKRQAEMRSPAKRNSAERRQCVLGAHCTETLRSPKMRLETGAHRQLNLVCVDALGPSPTTAPQRHPDWLWLRLPGCRHRCGVVGSSLHATPAIPNRPRRESQGLAPRPPPTGLVTRDWGARYREALEPSRARRKAGAPRPPPSRLISHLVQAHVCSSFGGDASPRSLCCGARHLCPLTCADDRSLLARSPARRAPGASRGARTTRGRLASRPMLESRA